MEVRHFFPGSNTSRGFYSRFAHILPAERVRRKVILKGGPGVGKSTFMHRMAEYLQTLDQTVEMFHCSSAPDSLDAVAAPGLGFALLDGTAPHVVDPVLPGAADGILNLGDCLNEAMLEKSRPEIVRTLGEISGCFLRAYDCLGAAAPLLAGGMREWRECTPPDAMAALARVLIDRWLPAGEGVAQERELFAEAYTPDGCLSLLPALLLSRVVRIDAPWGLSPHPLLARLRDAALDRGIPVLGLYNPMFPEELNHLNFPTLSLSVVSGPVEQPAEVVDLPEALSLNHEPSRAQANRDAHELLIARAVENLRGAKERHDDLEAWYVAAMDYAPWERAFNRVKEAVAALM